MLLLNCKPHSIQQYKKTTGFSLAYLLTGVCGNISDIKTLTHSIPTTEVPQNLEKDRDLAYERIKKISRKR